MSGSNLNTGLARAAAVVSAILCVTLCITQALRQDPAFGSLHGSVFSREGQRKLANARISLIPVRKDDSDADEKLPKVRHATSGPDGVFTMARVPAGDYTLSAVTRAHSSSNIPITILEGGTTETSLSLDRSQSPLQVKVHQRIFATTESPHLSLTGYADETARPGADRIQVTIWKTRLSEALKGDKSAQALEKVGSSWEPVPALPSDLLKPANAIGPSPVGTREVTIKEDPEGFFYQTIDFTKMGLKSQPAGLYLMDMKHHGATACAWLLITDTALIVKRSQNRLLGYAVDMQTGEPVSGSRLLAYQDGKIVVEGVTGKDGIGILNVPASATGAVNSDSDSRKVTLVATRGNDEAVVNRSYYRNEQSDSFTVHSYTDRPIYRPGQHVYFKSILRRTNSEPMDTMARYSVPAGQQAQVEVRDPSGERIYQSKLRANTFGSISGGLDIGSEAPTGVYTLKTIIGESTHTHDIVIASYRKPEFAVTVKPEKERYGQGEQVTMAVSAQYYFGAPVAGAKVKYDVSSSPDWATESISDNSGDDSSESESAPGVGRNHHEYYGASVTHGEARLDQNGKAVIKFSTENPVRPKFMRAAENFTLSATVTEGENREAEGDGTALVTPGEFHIAATPEGYVGAPGRMVPFVVAARDYNNKPVPNVNVDVEIGYQSWTRSSLLFKRIASQSVTLGADGKYSLDLSPPRAGEFVVKLRAHDRQNRLIVGRGSMFISDDSGGDLDTEYADLALLPDKRRYRPGDTARVLINSARTGQSVLLTIEGERLYYQQTVLMDRKSRVIKLPMLREYGPNAYVAACYVRDKHFAQSSASLRILAPQQELKVQVQADRPASGSTLARYGPGDRIRYTVKATDSQGRPRQAEVSLGVVDESIYALKEDDPSAIRDEFYPTRSNLVATEYSFAIQYLGDADKSEPKITARKRFPDTAFWNPSVITDAAGIATVEFTLPDNLTTWRATVRAHTMDTRVGWSNCKVVSSKLFLVRVQTPQFLTQKDQSEIVAFVHNNTGKSQTTSVHLTADNLAITGDAVQRLSLADGQIGEARWPVRADAFGDAKITVKAWTSKEQDGSQFTDGLENALPIRPHGREVLQGFSGHLSGAGSETEVLRLDAASVPALSRLTVRITPSISSALVGATDYLIGFPYGCTEQTMSRFMPDLLVQNALKSHGLQAPANSQVIPSMVRNGLQRLYRFQHSESGAWGWWEHDQDSAWMTAYVLYGLATARSQGYDVSDQVLSKGRKAAAKMAGDVKTDLNDRAFLIYAIALSGDRATALRERSVRIDPTKLSSVGLAYEVLTDQTLGRSDTEAISAMSTRTVVADGMLHWKTGGSDADWNDVGTTAICLRALIKRDSTDRRIAEALNWLMLKRGDSYWYSTRDTALTLAAFCDLINSQRADSGGGSIAVKLNGVVYQTVALNSNNLKEKEIVIRIATSSLRPDKNDVTLERIGGSSPIFYAVQLRQTVATEDLPPTDRATMQIKREYLRVVAKPAGSGYFTEQTEPTNNHLTGSDWVRVRLTITAPRDMSYVLIEDAFPSGCEVNERGDASDVTEWGYWWSSVDVRDDRIAFFCRSLSKGEHVIEYNLRAQTPGEYHVLPAMAQGMYAPETRSESSESRISVR